MAKETQKYKNMYYFVDNEGNKQATKPEERATPKYDSIVDYSSFRPDKEEERIARITGEGGKIGRYDTEGKIPSDLIVDIRQGKYDRAEVQEIVKQKGEELEEQQKNAISEARQEYLDQKTGFTGQRQEKDS